MIGQQDKFVHFIDYENVHKHVPMDRIARGKHQEVILFVGNQQTIPNEWLRLDYNVTTIRVKRTAKDNLDFHIAMYLGYKQKNTAPDVEMESFAQNVYVEMESFELIESLLLWLRLCHVPCQHIKFTTGTL